MGQALKVGVFATLCLIVLALLIWNIEDLNPFGPKGQKVDAVFASVAGLDDKAPVRVAGVRVGRVDGIRLEGHRPRVRLVLEQPIALTEGSFARISSLGLLGDKYVELVLGPESAPLLPEGTVLVGTAPPSFDETMAKLNQIGDSIQKVTGSFAGADVGNNLSSLIAEIQRTSEEIRALVAENRATVGSAVRNFDQVGAVLAQELPRLSSQTQRALDQISQVIGENRGNLSASMANTRDLTAKLQTSVDNLNRISDKIASGEGTIGKLVNDDKAYNEVLSTLDSIQGGVETLSGTFGAINKFDIELDMQGYYLLNGTQNRAVGTGGAGDNSDNSSYASFSLNIDPQDNERLYRAGISSTPSGKRRQKTQTFTVTNPDGTVETTTTDTLTEERSYVATGLFGYQAPKDVRLWAGLIESTAGAQIEYPLLDRRLWLSLEAFDFSRPQDLAPHLRLMGRYQLHPNLYLVGGLDDPLENDSFFLGGGIRWKDENLKTLLGLVPLK
jgi:phospholipid/cholesterol/gamma-HCH transport system substrate-binding protein